MQRGPPRGWPASCCAAVSPSSDTLVWPARSCLQQRRDAHHEELVEVGRRRWRGTSPARAADGYSSTAWSSTRWLNSSQLSSRLMYSAGSVKSLGSRIASRATEGRRALIDRLRLQKACRTGRGESTASQRVDVSARSVRAGRLHLRSSMSACTPIVSGRHGRGYPRPQIEREQWTSLNGEWDAALDFNADMARTRMKWNGADGSSCRSHRKRP